MNLHDQSKAPLKTDYDLITLKSFEITGIEQKYKSLQQKYKDLRSKYTAAEKENKELKRRLAINDNHEQLEDIFSKLSSLILTTKADNNLNLTYKEQSLIKELFGSKADYKLDLDQSNGVSRNLYSNQQFLRNIDTVTDSADEDALYSLADTFLKQTTLS